MPSDPTGVQVDPLLIIQRLTEKLALREQELAIAEVVIDQLHAQLQDNAAGPEHG